MDAGRSAKMASEMKYRLLALLMGLFILGTATDSRAAQVLWSGAAPFWAGGAAKDGLFYAADRSGMVRAFQIGKGLLWEANLNRTVLLSPVLSADGDTLYIASLTELFHLSPTDGAIRQRIGLPDQPVGFAVDARGTLYMATQGGLILAITASGTESWRIQLGETPVTAPVLDALGNLHVGTQQGTLFSLHGPTITSRTNLGSAITTPLAVRSDGVLLCGTQDGRMLGVDPWTPSRILFQTPTEHGPPYGGPAVDTESRSYWTVANTLIILNAEGSIEKRLLLDSADYFLHGPVLAGSTLWVVARNGWIYSIDYDFSTTVHSDATGRGGIMAPATADPEGHIYVETWDGDVLEFPTPAFCQDAPWSNEQQYGDRRGGSWPRLCVEPMSLDATTSFFEKAGPYYVKVTHCGPGGILQWKAFLSELQGSLSPKGGQLEAGKSLVLTLYLNPSSEAGEYSGALVFSSNDMTRSNLSLPVQLTVTETPYQMNSLTTLDEVDAFSQLFDAGEGLGVLTDDRLRILDDETGKVLTEKSLDYDVKILVDHPAFFYARPIVSNNRLYLGETDGKIHCYRLPELKKCSGSWPTPVGGLVYGALALSPSTQRLYAGTIDGKFLALSSEDGSILWQKTFPPGFFVEPLIVSFVTSSDPQNEWILAPSKNRRVYGWNAQGEALWENGFALGASAMTTPILFHCTGDMAQCSVAFPSWDGYVYWPNLHGSQTPNPCYAGFPLIGPSNLCREETGTCYALSPGGDLYSFGIDPGTCHHEKLVHLVDAPNDTRLWAIPIKLTNSMLWMWISSYHGSAYSALVQVNPSTATVQLRWDMESSLLAWPVVRNRKIYVMDTRGVIRYVAENP